MKNNHDKNKDDKTLCNFGGTNIPKSLGNTLLMNTNALSRIAFLPEKERLMLTLNVIKDEKENHTKN